MSQQNDPDDQHADQPASMGMGLLRSLTNRIQGISVYRNFSSKPEGDGWNYETQGEDWADDRALCAGCSRQSPIHFCQDIVMAAREGRGGVMKVTTDGEGRQEVVEEDASGAAEELKVEICYKEKPNMALKHMGATLQVKPDNDQVGFVKAGGIKYDLVQTHFHAPAEHTFIDSDDRHILEYHMVHANKEGDKLLVIGFTFLKASEAVASEFLTSIFSFEQPSAKDDVVKGLQLSFLPVLEWTKTIPLLHYKGSLTTPPCTENVEWYVGASPVLISEEQAEDIEANVFYWGNYRIQQNTKEQPYNDSAVTVTKAVVSAAAMEDEEEEEKKLSHAEVTRAAIKEFVERSNGSRSFDQSKKASVKGL